jgi:hypothetical protein
VTLALALWGAQTLLARWPVPARLVHGDLAMLAILAAVGAVAYGAVVLGLFGAQWLAVLRRRASAAPVVDLEPPAG